MSSYCPLRYVFYGSLISFFPGFCTRAGSLTNAEVRKKRNELFGKEKARQRALITRIEKIKVEHKGIPEDCTLLMNKQLSTPFNCAMRKLSANILCYKGFLLKSSIDLDFILYVLNSITFFGKLPQIIINYKLADSLFTTIL